MPNSNENVSPPENAFLLRTASTTVTDEEKCDHHRQMMLVEELESIIADSHCQKLFRLFLVFAGNQLIWSKEKRLLRFIRRVQAQFLLNQMLQIQYQMQRHPDRLFPAVHSEEDAQFGIGTITTSIEVQAVQPLLRAGDIVTFRALLDCVFALCPLQQQLEPLVDRMFARYVLQLIRKGFLLVRQLSSSSRVCSSPEQRLAQWHHQRHSLCHLLCEYKPKWRSFWCILVPGQMHIWPLAKVTDGKKKLPEWKMGRMAGRKTLKLRGNSQLEYVSVEFGGKRQELFVWRMVTNEGMFEFAHFDALQRQLWIADVELAIRKRRPSLLLQFDRANSLRQQMPSQQTAEELVAKFEEEKSELVEALEAEKKAVRDEQKVREMVTRMLDEEVRKVDNLRRTVHFLTNELEEERQQQRNNSNGRLPSEGEGEHRRKYGSGDDNDSMREGSKEDNDNIMMMGPIQRAETPVPKTKRGKKLREEKKQQKRMEEMQKEGEEERPE